MDEERRNRDFSKGPVWDPTTNRWFVEIRYPDGSRFRKRFRREREALRVWAAEQSKIENGTWDERAPRNVTLGDGAQAVSRLLEGADTARTRATSTPSLTLWEAHLGIADPPREDQSKQIEDFKLQRAQKVARSTTDKDLAILKAFFNWCIGHQLAVSNPVRRVKLFHEDNSRLRYLDAANEYEPARSRHARTDRDASPYLEEKIVLAAHTGLRRGSLFNLRWDQIDFANSVMRIPRTKTGRPLSLPLNATANTTLQKLHAAASRTATYVFPHKSGPKAGEPVQDIKNGFHAALETRRHRGLHLARPATHLRLVADDARRLATDRRRAARPPVDEDDDALRAPVAGVPVRGSEPARSADHRPTPKKGKKSKRARKGQSASKRRLRERKSPNFVKEIGSSGWIRTSNPPVNSRMLCR